MASDRASVAQAILRDIFAVAVDQDRETAAAARSAIEARETAFRLSDAIDDYGAAVAELCAAIAPAATRRASELAATLPTYAQIVTDLELAEAAAFLAPIFAEAGRQEPLAEEAVSVA